MQRYFAKPAPDVPKWSALLVEAVNKPGLIMEAYSAFHNYSIGNQILALEQCQLRGLEPGFRHAWEGACSAAKISGLRFHDLRHTFATRLRGKGVHEMDIMTLLGHTTLQMTSRYSHAMPENLRTAVDSLARGPLALVPRVANSQSEPSLTLGLLPRSAGSAPKSRQVATGTDGG